MFFVVVIGADYGLLVPWGIFKPPWKEGRGSPQSKCMSTPFWYWVCGAPLQPGWSLTNID
jgi:hypothetical protein